MPAQNRKPASRPLMGVLPPRCFPRAATAVALTLGLLLSSACNNPPVSKTPNMPETGSKTVSAPEPGTPPPVDRFIVDHELDPVTKAVKGPLLNYQLKIDDVLDRKATDAPKSGKLSGETIVFGLPDGMGDIGEAFDITLRRAAELFVNSPDRDKVLTEVDAPGTMALVRFETLGFPSGMATGASIPVVVIPQGNARDLTGGHIYRTLLRCDQTGEALAYHDYGIFDPGKIQVLDTYSRDASDVLNEGLDDKYKVTSPIALPENAPDGGLSGGAKSDPTAKPAPKGTPAPNKPQPPVNKPAPTPAAPGAAPTGPQDKPFAPVEPLEEVTGKLVRRRFMLVDFFTMTRATRWNETGRDVITIAVGQDPRDEDSVGLFTGRRSGDIAEEVMDGVMEALQKIPESVVRLEEYRERQRQKRREKAGVAITDREKQNHELTLRLAKTFAVHVERLGGDESRRLIVVPSARSVSMDELYEMIRIARCKVRPRRQIHIITDDQFGRIIIAGPQNERKLSDRLTFGANGDDKSEARASGDFRLVATLVDSGRSLKVAWARLQKGSVVEQGEQQVANDIGELLRVAYSGGCSPDDCFFLVSECSRLRLLNARIALNPRRLAPKINTAG